MTDLISKRQMVEKINDLFLDKYEAKANSDLTEFYKEVLKILINEKGQSNWIPVKDGLPEDDGEYMVWSDEFEICEFDAESQTFGYTYYEYDEMYSRLVCWDDCINKKVTHWTYLPDAPESEGIE